MTVPTCHPDRLSYRRGMCRRCYYRYMKSIGKPQSHGNKAYCKERNVLRVYKSRLRKYGVTEEWYVNTLYRQGGACAICGQPPVGRRGTAAKLHVDHHHDSGRVRELICSGCNVAIGQLKESPELCELLAAYLRKHAAP